MLFHMKTNKLEFLVRGQSLQLKRSYRILSKTSSMLPLSMYCSKYTSQLTFVPSYSKKTLNFTAPARGGERLVPSAKGFMTLNEFQKVSEGDKESNQMRGLGFTDHQIKYVHSLEYC